MTWDECLSAMELLEIRESGLVEDSSESAHLRTCARCGALLQTMPALESVHAPEQTPRLKARRIIAVTVDDVHAGQVWTAKSPDAPDRRFIVVVMGRRKDSSNMFVVCPTSVELEEATDLDLLVDQSPVGYPFMVCAWHFGAVFRSQLEDCLGSLSDNSLETLKALYRHALVGKGEVSFQGTGPGVGGPNDPRLIWRTEQLEKWRSLWHPVRQRVVEMEADSEAAETGPEPKPLAPSLGDVVGKLVEGEEWDEPSLAETAHVPAAHLGVLLRNRLDLTDQSDVDSVAAVIHTLEFDSEDAELLLRRTLEKSPGGLRIGTAGTDRVAARSFADVSDATRARELREGLSKIDDSPRARQRAIDAYVETVLQRLDDLA